MYPIFADWKCPFLPWALVFIGLRMLHELWHLGKYTSPTWILWVSGNSKFITLHWDHDTTNPNNGGSRSFKGGVHSNLPCICIKFDPPSRDMLLIFVRRNQSLLCWVLIYLRSSNKRCHGIRGQRQGTFQKQSPSKFWQFWPLRVLLLLILPIHREYTNTEGKSTSAVMSAIRKATYININHHTSEVICLASLSHIPHNENGGTLKKVP